MATKTTGKSLKSLMSLTNAVLSQSAIKGLNEAYLPSCLRKGKTFIVLPIPPKEEPSKRERSSKVFALLSLEGILQTERVGALRGGFGYQKAPKLSGEWVESESGNYHFKTLKLSKDEEAEIRNSAKSWGISELIRDGFSEAGVPKNPITVSVTETGFVYGRKPIFQQDDGTYSINEIERDRFDDPIFYWDGEAHLSTKAEINATISAYKKLGGDDVEKLRELLNR